MPIMVSISYSQFAVNFPVVYQKTPGKTQYYPYPPQDKEISAPGTYCFELLRQTKKEAGKPSCRPHKMGLPLFR